MFEFMKPFPLKDMPLKPEMTGRPKLDETMIQTLAALCGWDGEARRLLRSTLAGDLFMASPPVCCIVNKVTNGAGEDITFGDIPTTEVMIKALATNSDDVWVNVEASAAEDTGWPLDAGDHVQFSIDNLSKLKIHVVSSGDKVVIVRTV